MLGSRGILVGILSCTFFSQPEAFNSTVLPLNTAREALIKHAQRRNVFGNSLDSIALTELPGYTGWNRDKVNSVVDQCSVSKIGNQKVKLNDQLNILQHDISESNHVWSISIACPNVTIPDELDHLPMPVFYARAYGPAILVGSQSDVSSLNQSEGPYTTTTVSFVMEDPGLYTVEVVLESIFSPNVYTLPQTNGALLYEGFLLPGFPLILNVTSSNAVCSTAKSCNMTLCKSEDIESDLTSSTARWIVLGHVSKNTKDKKFFEEKLDGELFRRYADGYNRLGIETDYIPSKCVLSPLQSSLAFHDSCFHDTGIHYILMGDSVTQQHLNALKQLLSPYNRITWIDLKGGITAMFNATSQKLWELQMENSTQPKVVVFNAGLHEIANYCELPLEKDSYTVVENCALFYRKEFARLLDLVVSTFPSDLKIFRTTNAGWVRWGNLGFKWGPNIAQMMFKSPHTVKSFNDIALQVIRESAYNVKVYDLFWMTLSRPDDTQIIRKKWKTAPLIHLGHGLIKVSVRKLITIVTDHFGCFLANQSVNN